MDKYSVFGLNFCASDYDTSCKTIIKKAKERKSYTVAALNAHGLMLANQNENFRETANNIDLILPDGMSIVWALNRIHGLRLKERVAGPDLTLHLLARADKNKLRIFLYGSYKDTVNKFAQFIDEKFPNVIICGIHADRFRESSETEDQKDIEMINKSEANIVFVGRGCPRQEYWVESHKNKIHAVMIGIGGAFDIYSQKLKRAPKWIQKSGLEWLYRLLLEPRRLWERYLFSITHFIILVLNFYLKKIVVYLTNKKLIIKGSL